MRRVLFDLTALKSVGDSRFHGGGEYSLALLSFILDTKPSDGLFFLFDADYSVLDQRIAGLIDQSRIIRFSRIQEIPALAERYGIELFVSGLPYRYRRVDFGDLPCMFTIHGLRRIELPYDKMEPHYIHGLKERAQFLFRRIFTSLFLRLKLAHTRQLLHASRNMTIIVPSEHTKHSLLYHFQELRPEDLFVSYSPLPKSVVPGEATLSGDEGFYLLVSTHRWGKNAYRAVKAFDILFSNGRLAGKRVVLLGMNRMLFKQFGVKNHSRFTIRPYVEREEYEALMRDAYALVYPSLNEGFGYPPYEAMKYGTPVALSAICSLPEVYGTEVLFFNPYDINEIGVRILELEEWNLKSCRSGEILAEADRIRRMQEGMTVGLVDHIMLG